MSRYVTRAVKMAPDGSWDDPLLPHLSVDGPREVDTGLVDQNGYSIYRLPPPIGFGNDKDW